MPEIKPEIETIAKIAVVGIGGGGNSAINRMVEAGIKGVDFIAVNTDVQALHQSLAKNKLHIGKGITRGLGAGMNPEKGTAAAQESQNEIRDLLKDKDMVFITCGLGGGTGSGAAPVVAELAKDSGALTVAVVTRPFNFEGAQRRDIAEKAYDTLREKVDTIITIPNDRVLHITDKQTSFLEAFRLVDEVLRQGVQGISELITVPGHVNVDFADVRTIMENAGSALMGIGQASGENRALEAAKQAIASPLLDLSIDGARGILMVVSGDANMGMQEIQEASKVITGSADENARVIWGAVVDDTLDDGIKITVIATNFEGERRAEELQQKSQPQEEEKPATFRSARRVLQEPIANEPEDYFGMPEPAAPPVVAEPSVSIPVAEKTPEEEELEIPAFIRKKMGG